MNRFVINMAFVAALTVPPTEAAAQTTHYTPVETGRYEAYMNFTGQVVQNGVPVNGAEVAVFVAGECRQAQLSHNLSGTSTSGQPYSFDGLVTSFLAWGQSHRENITFKVWLPGGEERELAAVCPLVVDSRTGMPSAPFVLDVDKTAHNVPMNFRREGDAVIGTYSTETESNPFDATATFTYDGLTIVATDTKTTDNPVNYISQEEGLRLAPGATLTITAPEGQTIVGVWPLSISHGIVLDQTGAKLNYDGWTGRAKTVMLTNPSATSTYSLAGLEVRYAKAFLLGDVNDDGLVDVSDYIGVANYILGSTPSVFIFEAGDVNEDGHIDVSDYIGVANIILNGK